MGRNKSYDAEIEYLESGSEYAPYINLELIPKGYDNDFFVGLLVNEILILKTNTRLIGAHTSTTHNSYRILRLNGTNLIRFENGCIAGDYYNGVQIEENVKYDIEVFHDYTFKVNGISGIISNPVRGSENNSPFYLFSSPIVPQMNLRIYYFRWEKNGKILLNLIPVRIGDEGFMYDKVSGKLFGNSGEGKFLLGPDI